jgi:prophage regulatory protein
MAQPEKLFVRAREIVSAGIVPSKATLWRWVEEGRFPKPITLGPHAKAFRQADVDRWLAERTGEPLAAVS